MKGRLLLAAGLLVAPLASASPAVAEVRSVTATSGPVMAVMMPLRACNGSVCQSTPSLWTVGLRVAVLTDSAGLPTIVQGSCPLGIGTALVVRAGSAGGIVTAVVFGTRLDGSSYEQAIGLPVILGANGTVTVQVCF
jgi:hypothetical protein